jgi:hypothetical protein
MELVNHKTHPCRFATGKLCFLWLVIQLGGFVMKRSFLYVAAASALIVASAGAAKAGNIFLTGHDPDFHAVAGNTTGAQDINRRAISFVTGGIASPNLLLITDVTSPGAGYSDPRLGLTASGFTYSVADFGSGAPGVLNLNTVNFSNYNAIIIASDFGGWLRQSELNILNSRSADIIKYLNAGGGLYAMAESGPPNGLTTSGQFGFLPFVVSSTAFNQTEVGNTLTPFGSSLGLVNSDINGNFSHNIFNGTFGLNAVDFDSSGNILSLAGSGTVTVTGVVPEPASLTLLCIGIAGIVGYGWRRRRN